MIPLALLGNTLFPDFAWFIGGVGVACIPAAIGVAILKYRLYDIDVIVNRTLVYGGLTAYVIGIYVLIVGYLGALLRTDGNLAVSLVATGIVAVAFAPLRNRLQRFVNRLMYGERDDPYAVLSRLGESLENALAPEAALAAVAESVAQSLKLPHAAITLEHDGHFVTAAEFGTPVGEPIILPLTHHSEVVGRMVVSPRSPGEEFSPADRRLLDDLRGKPEPPPTPPASPPTSSGRGSGSSRPARRSAAASAATSTTDSARDSPPSPSSTMPR
jgi:hypothetical protein